MSKRETSAEENWIDLVEEPNLAVVCGLGHTVAIVVKQDSLRLGTPSTMHAKLLHLFNRWIQLKFVASLLRGNGKMSHGTDI